MDKGGGFINSALAGTFFGCGLARKAIEQAPHSLAAAEQRDNNQQNKQNASEDAHQLRCARGTNRSLRPIWRGQAQIAASPTIALARLPERVTEA